MAAVTDIKQFNLANGQLAERKELITVAEWQEPTHDGTTTGVETVRAILGVRTEDSSIEYNADIQQSTDIRGNNYTDVNKTQPTQTFDPHPIMGGDRLAAFLNNIRRRNALSELNQFTVYVITKFIGDSTNGYEAEKHTDCTINYSSIGGDSRVNFPYEVYFSNKITNGTVDKIAEDFVFTPDATL